MKYHLKFFDFKCLKEESSILEKRQFVDQTLKWSRVNRHENVVALIGVSMDLPPFLAIMESTASNLKTFLLNSRGKYVNLLTSTTSYPSVQKVNLQSR